MEVLVFGGTVEGRQLVEWLDARGCSVVVCVATDYGASLLPSGGRVTCLQGPLSHEEKLSLVDGHSFCCIVDATHPYAQHITQSVARLGAEAGLPVIRVLREDGEADAFGERVPDARAAAKLVAESEGNVLLTTGSKDLDVYVAALADAPQRLYVRILPLASAVEHAAELGIPTSHLIAMQGPFSQELNEALIRQLDIRTLVTKQSGASGGFEEKVAAARACQVRLIVIERPEEREGVSLAQAEALLEERYGL
jgi:precorrin-6x reductase